MINTAALQVLVDVPPRQYVTSGPTPVFDCEQVVVNILTMNTGLPGASVVTIPVAVDCTPMWTVICELVIVRCAPPVVRGTQTTDSITAAFQTSSIDTGILIDAVDMIREDNFFGNISASITVRSDEGGMIATVCRLSAGLP
jgi:hypothetical protein